MMKRKNNQNVEYADHTNSSTPAFTSTSACSTSLASLIRNMTIPIKDNIKLKPLIKIENPQKLPDKKCP